jgi:pyridinium-3,5-biscarboxylic acid mononucleotide synthase
MPHNLDGLDEFANLDLARTARTGIPEVVLAERKSPAQTVAIVERLLSELGRALVSRVPPETLAALEQTLGNSATWVRYAEGRTIALHRPVVRLRSTAGV